MIGMPSMVIRNAIAISGDMPSCRSIKFRPSLRCTGWRRTRPLKGAYACRARVFPTRIALALSEPRYAPHVNANEQRSVDTAAVTQGGGHPSASVHPVVRVAAEWTWRLLVIFAGLLTLGYIVNWLDTVLIAG